VKTKVRSYVLSHREFRRLHGRAYRAQQRGHEEVCGILAVRSRSPRELLLHFVSNRSERAGSFRMRDREVRGVRRDISAGDLRPIGLFHSHPVGSARLGPRDKRATPLNRFHLVYDVCALEPRLWRMVRRRSWREALEVPLVVQRSSNGNAR